MGRDDDDDDVDKNMHIPTNYNDEFTQREMREKKIRKKKSEKYG